MEFTYLEKCINAKMSIRDISLKSGKSYTTVRYWLKKHDLSTGLTSIADHKKNKHRCSFCGESDPSKFYGNKRTRCAKCHNQDVINRGNALKKWAIAYKGGCCSICGYKKSDWALQFHHISPDEKDKGWKSMKGWSKARIKTELEHCILLCANCHAEEHEKLFNKAL